MPGLPETIGGTDSAKCAFKHQQVEGEPDSKPRMNGDNSAVALFKNSRHFGCIFPDTDPPRSSSILRKGTTILKTSDKVTFSLNALRHTRIWIKKGPSLGMFQPTNLLREARTLQNSRICLRKRQKSKSDAPAKMSGDWPRVS